MTVYMKVTRDKFRLPVAVADSVPELARMLGTNADNIHAAISHGRKTFVKVEIEEEE